MDPRLLLWLICLYATTSYGQGIEVVQGHAHNDYENERPLFDALENGLISVEADVHLINGQLYVSHDLPEQPDPALTLENLYLKPLQDHILKNIGSVYPGYSGPFYLLVDFKSSARQSYDRLKEILGGYLPVISVIRDGEVKGGPVQILISGNRPVSEILNDEPKLVRLDGRPQELKRNIPVSVMPVVSDRYSNFLSWDGNGEVSGDELERFEQLVRDTHDEGRILRLWAIPDHAEAWGFLLDNGMDLINTDHPAAFRAYMMERHAGSR